MVEISMFAFMGGWASPSLAERNLQTLRHHGGEPCQRSPLPSNITLPIEGVPMEV
jgi:hypothetical protein